MNLRNIRKARKQNTVTMWSLQKGLLHPNGEVLQSEVSNTAEEDIPVHVPSQQHVASTPGQKCFCGSCGIQH